MLRSVQVDQSDIATSRWAQDSSSLSCVHPGYTETKQQNMNSKALLTLVNLGLSALGACTHNSAILYGLSEPRAYKEEEIEKRFKH